MNILEQINIIKSKIKNSCLVLLETLYLKYFLSSIQTHNSIATKVIGWQLFVCLMKLKILCNTGSPLL